MPLGGPCRRGPAPSGGDCRGAFPRCIKCRRTISASSLVPVRRSPVPWSRRTLRSPLPPPPRPELACIGDSGTSVAVERRLNRAAPPLLRGGVLSASDRMSAPGPSSVVCHGASPGSAADGDVTRPAMPVGAVRSAPPSSTRLAPFTSREDGCRGDRRPAPCVGLAALTPSSHQAGRPLLAGTVLGVAVAGAAGTGRARFARGWRTATGGDVPVAATAGDAARSVLDAHPANSSVSSCTLSLGS